MIEKLIDRLNNLSPMSDVLSEKIRSITKIENYPAGSFILKEGQVCKKACMVVTGLARSFYVNEGREITSRFMDEGFIITSWISYYTQKPGNEYIEAAEETVLASIEYNDIQKVYKEFPESNIIGRKQTEYTFGGFISGLIKRPVLEINMSREKWMKAKDALKVYLPVHSN